jgi:hypothetical protein
LILRCEERPNLRLQQTRPAIDGWDLVLRGPATPWYTARKSRARGRDGSKPQSGPRC